MSEDSRTLPAADGGRAWRALSEWGPVLAWAGLIFWFSAQPNLRVASDDSLDLVVRKAGHMFVFGVLAVLFWRALAEAAIRFAPLLAWILASLYAVTDEFHQGFTGGRHASPVDVSIDSLGALLGLTFVVLAARIYSSAVTGRARMLKPPST